MVVIGGGFLGSELACALGHRGTNLISDSIMFGIKIIT